LLSQIAWDGSKKLPVRLVVAIDEAMRAGRPIRRLLMPIAAWMRFIAGQAKAGIPIVDPDATRLASVGTACSGDAHADLLRFAVCESVLPPALQGTREGLRQACRAPGGAYPGVVLMSTTRRTFIAAATTVAATKAGATPAVNNIPKLVHHVFFWLKNPKSKEDLARLLEGLRSLARIEAVRAVHFGVPASTEKRDVVDNSFSASEILFFDDTAGQKIYQDHPIHKKFVADCSHLWERVVVYDTMSA
jgi:hypothetical protein